MPAYLVLEQVLVVEDGVPVRLSPHTVLDHGLVDASAGVRVKV